MAGEPTSGGGNGGRLVLVAMIFAVSMMFIDQTIVAIAAPELQSDLGLSETGVQWIINGYLLSLSALFAFGGKLADVVGHKTMVIIGVVVFATSSALCGATPADSSISEPWIITFRVIQGAGAALMFPAALAIVLSAFPIEGRGKALAAFFGITGALTAVGPFAGGYLTEWTWRSIFWINIPVAIIALVLTARAVKDNERRPAPIDYRGLVLIAAGMGLAVLGLQQAANWGWTSPETLGCIAVGIILLGIFARHALTTENPLIRLRFFKSRAFTVDALVVAMLMVVFVPICFFASTYAQISLGEDASNAGLFLLVYFGGFGIATQWGGNILDKTGARPTVVAGGIVGAVGLYLWAQALPDLDFSNQWYWLAMAGAGAGLILSPASTDAMNRVPGSAYGEVTGLTQTLRNFGSSLGLAILGSILITQTRTNIEDSFAERGLPQEAADDVAASLSDPSAASGSSDAPAHIVAEIKKMFEDGTIPGDYADATQTVVYCMAGVMAAIFVYTLARLPSGKVDPNAPPEVTGD
jgi:EmrB/QacA subfamily drug resistance transporter